MKHNPTLGGTVIIRNAIALDYCIRECLESMLAVCDKVVVLDAGSTDGTLEYIYSVQLLEPNLKVISGAWGPDTERFFRLSRLLNDARNYLDTDWHLMMQGDEVIHEDSFPWIRKAIERPFGDGYSLTRLNLYGDLNHCVRFDLPNERKPTADRILCLGRREYPTHGDGDHLLIERSKVSLKYLRNIVVFHYGYVRDDVKQIQRIKAMPDWFWGPGSPVDTRLGGMTEVFDWRKWHTAEDLMEIPMPHPKFSKAWADERQARKTIPVGQTRKFENHYLGE